MISKILVTGGSGWIGRFLVERLVAEGNEVTNYDIQQGFDILDGVELGKSFRDGDYDMVYHLAAQAFFKAGELNPHKDIDVNIHGMLNILQCIDEHDVPMIYTSTGAVYGLTEDFPLREDSPCVPVANYGVSKLAAEQYLKKRVLTKGVDARIARLSSVYGPFRTEGPVNIFINMALKSKPINVYGDGSQTRDVVHIQDILRGLDVVKKKGVSGEVYNVGSGAEASVREIAEEVGRQCDVEVRFDLDYEFPPFDVRRYCYDITKLSALGYSPEISLSDGVELTLKEMK